MKPISPGTVCYLVDVPMPYRDFEGKIVVVESGPAIDPKDGVPRYTTSASWWDFPIYVPRHRLLPISDPHPAPGELRRVEA